MTIGASMKQQVISISARATVRDAVRLIVENHVGTLPVVDDDNKLVGIVRLADVLKVFMPDFATLMENIDFVHDFGASEIERAKGWPEAANRGIQDLMASPIAVRVDSGLLSASSVMIKHEIQDLPVVDQNGRLVGIASRVDIAVAYLAPYVEEDATR